MLREWKCDTTANEDRYAEFMRVVTKRQLDYKPDTADWLLLEEIKADYEASRHHSGHKLVCKDSTT